MSEGTAFKKKLTVAWLCPYPVSRLPIEKTGVDKSKIFHPATWLVNLSQALVRRREIDLHIITETPWVLKDSSFSHEGITFHVLRTPYSIPFLKRGLPSWTLLPVATKFILDVRKLQVLLKKIRPDIVHAHGTEYQYAHAALKSSFPAVITLQGVIGFLKRILKGKTWDIQEKIEQEDIRRGKHFISHAGFADQYVKKLNPGAEVRHIDDIVSEEFFKRERTPNPTKLLFVGSVMKTKGVEDLLDACSRLLLTHSFILTIVGNCPEPYKSYIQNKIEELGLQQVITLAGHVSNEELQHHYQTAGIFTFPSHFETSPNVIMEAMSMGLPIVTTRVGGIPDMITHQKTGLLVEVEDAAGLADAISQLLSAPEVAAQFGSQARMEAAGRFREGVVADKVLEYYRDIVTK
jgi:glycosyltransferase involved in cell wall biosynthesis